MPEERRFVGFDAYQKAMDCLKPGDVVIFATPLAFRWVHFKYAIEKGLNVFMEKPLTADGPTSKRMLKLAEEATAKNLKVGVGLMSRHARPLQELHKRIQNGEIGDIVLMRGYRMHGPARLLQVAAQAGRHQRPGVPDPALPQLPVGQRRLLQRLLHPHHRPSLLDEERLAGQGAGAWAAATTSTTPDGTPFVDQNFDTYSVEYTFADGSKFFFDGRCMDGRRGHLLQLRPRHQGHAPSPPGPATAARPSASTRARTTTPTNLLWQSTDSSNPYQNEWDDLIDAIRNDKPYNEVKRGVEASLVTSMGRMAAHTGQEITFDQMLNCEHEFAPGLDKLTNDSPAPLQPDANGRYPVPQPGINTKREY